MTRKQYSNVSHIFLLITLKNKDLPFGIEEFCYIIANTLLVKVYWLFVQSVCFLYSGCASSQKVSMEPLRIVEDEFYRGHISIV